MKIKSKHWEEQANFNWNGKRGTSFAEHIRRVKAESTMDSSVWYG